MGASSSALGFDSLSDEKKAELTAKFEEMKTAGTSETDAIQYLSVEQLIYKAVSLGVQGETPIRM
jgi:hypothetical protein